MKIKKIKKILNPLPPHKVTLKAISNWDVLGHEHWKTPSEALDYLCKQFSGSIRVVKQKQKSITVLFCCGNTVYEQLKLNFICHIGHHFIWKD